jgi:hypothetical protein
VNDHISGYVGVADVRHWNSEASLFALLILKDDLLGFRAWKLRLKLCLSTLARLSGLPLGAGAESLYHLLNPHRFLKNQFLSMGKQTRKMFGKDNPGIWGIACCNLGG